MSTRSITGWGKTSPSAAQIIDIVSSDNKLDKGSFKPFIIPRGMGRSYGDAAQSAGGSVLLTSGLNSVIDSDFEKGVITVESGISLDELMKLIIPQGWFVPVTPGTRFVSIGGAIAADIHGKNHHKDGTFSQHVLSAQITTPNAKLEISPNQNQDLWWATVGGMGLTGLITQATIQLQKISTSKMIVDTERTQDLEQALEKMSSGDQNYQHSVAWIDCLAKGKSLGRSILLRGNHATLDDLNPKQRQNPLEFNPKSRIKAPSSIPSGLLNKFTVGAFNQAWYQKAPKFKTGQITSIPSFFHPLDGVLRWNSLYGSRGFIQYQFVIPFGTESMLRAIVEKISHSSFAPFLTVLKRFGEQNKAMMSFPMLGWTLALDIAVKPGLSQFLDTLDDMVASVGGRVYLAKDSRLRPELFEMMYPNINQWRKIQKQYDPNAIMGSDLSRRLGLIKI